MEFLIDKIDPNQARQFSKAVPYLLGGTTPY